MIETNEKNEDITNGDESLLLVKGGKQDREYIKKLSNAMVECFYKHNKAKFRCIGAAANNNADKSFIVARDKIFEESGDVLAYASDFVTITLNGGETTGVIKETINIISMLKEDEDDYDIGVNKDNLLLVRGAFDDKKENAEYVKKLGNAILQVFLKHNKVNLRCVGAGAVNNADKALIIAKGEAFKQGDILACIPEFTTVKFDNGEKTGIVKCVFNIKDLYK